MKGLEAFTTRENSNFFLIAGPCVVESEQLMDEVADQLSQICQGLNISLILKGSYRKANRSKASSFTGIGDETALRILHDISRKYNLPVTTDIHKDEDAALAAAYVDVLQIPAFLCRQSSLLEAAAHTGKVVNIKKGQFMSPAAMRFAVEKVRESGNENVWLTDRGTTFGYHDLVVDFRGIPEMKSFDVPVVMDCTHSLQQPNQTAGVTGGRPDMIETIARAAIAVGADGLFIETHPQPSIAKSDGANMLPLHNMEALLSNLTAIREVITKIG